MSIFFGEKSVDSWYGNNNNITQAYWSVRDNPIYAILYNNGVLKFQLKYKES